jgi:hypothetical protein
VILVSIFVKIPWDIYINYSPVLLPNTARIPSFETGGHASHQLHISARQRTHIVSFSELHHLPIVICPHNSLTAIRYFDISTEFLSCGRWGRGILRSDIIVATWGIVRGRNDPKITVLWNIHILYVPAIKHALKSFTLNNSLQALQIILCITKYVLVEICSYRKNCSLCERKIRLRIRWKWPETDTYGKTYEKGQ